MLWRGRSFKVQVMRNIWFIVAVNKLYYYGFSVEISQCPWKLVVGGARGYYNWKVRHGMFSKTLIFKRKQQNDPIRIGELFNVKIKAYYDLICHL